MGKVKNIKKRKVKPITVIVYIILILLAVIYVVPLLWMVSVSLKTNTEIFQNPFNLPEAFRFVNYKVAWTTGKLGIASLNSVIVCGISLVITMLIGSMAAFAIGRMKWRLANYVLTYFLLGMMIPVHCVLIPLFMHFSNLGLVNSLVGLILPYVTFSLPMSIFIMVNFYRNLPTELFEAACIDGCSIYQVFFKIALPLAKTGLFVAGLMTFVNNWNELLLAMVFISDVMKSTLPVTLTHFVGPHQTNYVQMFAGVVIAIAPSILIYTCFSNQIVEGLTAGAVKG